MSVEREFSLEEVNALLPELHRLVARQLMAQHHIEQAIGVLHQQLGHLPREFVVRGDDAPEIASLKVEIGELLEQVDEGWGQVQALGGVVKDASRGLVDFLGRHQGRRVFFCWCFGEESVAHYHELDEGFAGRKPLTVEARHRLFN